MGTEKQVFKRVNKSVSAYFILQIRVRDEIEVMLEPLAKVFFERLSSCNKRASRAAPWYSVFGKRLFITGDASEAEKDNIMADGNAATEFVS
jgi:hypothetical protein